MNGNQGSGSTGGAKGKCQVCESTTCGAVDSIPRFAVISDYFTSGGLLGLFFFPFFFSFQLFFWAFKWPMKPWDLWQLARTALPSLRLSKKFRQETTESTATETDPSSECINQERTHVNQQKICIRDLLPLWPLSEGPPPAASLADHVTL